MIQRLFWDQMQKERNRKLVETGTREKRRKCFYFIVSLLTIDY